MKAEHRRLVWVQYGIILGSVAAFGSLLYHLCS